MKIMIASDIHGSSRFCSMLLKACEKEDPDRLLLLGDLLYHGPRNALPDDYDTKKTIEMLNSLKNRITAIRGNCDSEVDQMVLNFPIMNSYEVLEIGDGITVFAAHGHNYSPDSPPPFVEFDVILNGHTHIPALKKYERFLYVNPGSVSIPKGGSGHSYAVYENRVFKLKNLSDCSVYDSAEL